MWTCKCGASCPDTAVFCNSCGSKKEEDAPVTAEFSKELIPSVIVTTTDSVEGRSIKEYLGMVSGTDIYLVGGVFGGGLSNQENLFGSASDAANKKMIQKAVGLGADAVVGTQINVVSPGGMNNIIVIVSGTAVKLNEI